MPLFETDPERMRNGNIVSNGVELHSTAQILKVSGRYLAMHNALGDIKQDSTIHFITAGQWSMHDLLIYVLGYTGPADAYCFSFSWGPDACNALINLKDRGEIRKLYIVTHKILKRWSMKSLKIIEGQAEKISMVLMHAKGFLLVNDKWNISVIGSANFSFNSSIECGVITNDRQVYKMHRRWIDAALDDGDKFMDDLYQVVPADIPPAEINDKILFLVRGLPGSGKTTLAHKIADEVFEIDDYFMAGGKYEFDKNRLSKAHGECINRCRNAMQLGVKKIAVANSFGNPESMIPYYKFASMFGYTVFSLVTENRSNTKNIHGISDDEIKLMKKKFKVQL